MQRYFLELCFKGTNHSGWQIQENAVSVQEKVNNALSLLQGNNIETAGCGRTDTGVHAKQFFAQFDSITSINNHYKFIHNLNGILPNDITVFDLHEVDGNASARFDARLRTYEYYLHRYKNPFLKEFAAAMFFDVDVNKINEACEILLEYNDFECFSKSRTDVKHFICNIKGAKWEQGNEFHKVTITANRFLRGMVRTIVGTLQQVGKNEISIDEFRKIIESKKRSEAGVAVDACGLYLSKIEYPFLNVERKFEFPFKVK